MKAWLQRGFRAMVKSDLWVSVSCSSKRLRSCAERLMTLERKKNAASGPGEPSHTNKIIDRALREEQRCPSVRLSVCLFVCLSPRDANIQCQNDSTCNLFSLPREVTAVLFQQCRFFLFDTVNAINRTAALSLIKFCMNVYLDNL